MSAKKAEAKNIFSYKKFWAERLGPAPFLPMSREEMDQLGWDKCDIILVTGDAYVDLPSFGMALIGRLLEAQGFRVGIIAQPDWKNVEDFRRLGPPALFWGVTAGNMDSMVNRYTSNKKVRSDDAYTPGGEGGSRPDRSVIVYSQRCREAFKDAPVVIGGIEASLRRIAQYDYWSGKVRRSVLLDSRADILLFGNAERAIVSLAHRLAAGENIESINDLRGTATVSRPDSEGWTELDKTKMEAPVTAEAPSPAELVEQKKAPEKTDKVCVRLPSFEEVDQDKDLYAHASRILHQESNPGNARALVQRHGEKDVWLNPPPIPLTTPEMDYVFELPYARSPHPFYGQAKIPAFEMIQHSVIITRGCFGGCTFCSITEHEGRIIQNRSEDSVIREIETIKEKSPDFKGHISDLGGPTANMYRLACKSKEIEKSCRRLSCIHPKICSNLNTDHTSLIKLYRRARELKGVKKILVASGLRYDLAVESPEYIKELATHHTGGYLKIAPEHTESGPLSKMMKPGMDRYHRFKELFDKFSKEAGKEQYLIPYFIAAHPGTTKEDMLHLAIWLKKNSFRADQVQAFLPSPMSMATAMYRSGKNPLRTVRKDSENVYIPRSHDERTIHKAFLRYHDPNNWPLLRRTLRQMGRGNLIGYGEHCLIPTNQPKGTGDFPEGKRGKSFKEFKTQQTHGIKKSGARPGKKTSRGKTSIKSKMAGAVGGKGPKKGRK